MDRDTLIQRFFVFTVLAAIAAIVYSMVVTKYTIPNIDKPEENKPIIISDTFSEANFKFHLLLTDIKFPDIVFAQARLETGNFKSVYFKERNNCFGFRNKNGYMFFKSWIACIEYYARWQRKYYKGGDYFKFLTKIGYAEADSIYKKRVLSCIKLKSKF